MEKQVKRVPIQVRIPIISDKQFDCPYEEPFGYIYMITNRINGHYYIGQHEFHHPWLDKKYKGSGSALGAAYKKYGIESFDTIILEWVDEENKLDELEIHWIDMFSSYLFPFHYNLTEGGEHGPSMCGEDNPNYKNHWSEDKKLEQSKRMKEYYKIHEPYNKGRKLTKEECDELSKRLTGLKHKPHSEETKLKISEALKDKPKQKDTWNKGLKMNEDFCKRISESCKGRNKGVTQGCCVCRKIVRLTMNYKLIKVYDYINQAKEDGFPTKTCIIDCCKGRRKSYNGYIWKYLEDYKKNKR